MIKFIKSPIGIGFSYKEGHSCELSQATEKELVERGFAEFVDGEKIQKAEAKPKAEKAVKK